MKVIAKQDWLFRSNIILRSRAHAYTCACTPTIGKHASRTGTKLLEQYNTHWLSF